MSTDDWIELSADPLDFARAVSYVSVPTAGGVDVFLGLTRAETNADGRTLEALDYEAYEPMALEQMRRLAGVTRQKWPVQRLAMLHRTGRVGLAEASVIIAVSTPHRAEAFDACRYCIDTLKRDVPIWKKEIWQDGRSTWVAGQPVQFGEGPRGDRA